MSLVCLHVDSISNLSKMPPELIDVIRTVLNCGMGPAVPVSKTHLIFGTGEVIGAALDTN